jgi:hypothetical protein
VTDCAQRGKQFLGVQGRLLVVAYHM